MGEAAHFGFLSVLPALIAVILAFITRDAIFSLLVACLSGLAIVGGGPAHSFSLIGALRGFIEFPLLFEKTLGNADYIWVLQIEIFIGILIGFLQKSGSTREFERRMKRKIKSRKQVQVFSWFLSIAVFFSDYFTPLFVGPVMRGISDKAKVSREKLSYILDSTSAPKCVLIPFSGWAVFIAGLLIGYGPIVDKKIAINVFIKSIPYDFYAIFAVGLVILIATGVIPEFGPMKKAEMRALKEGKVIDDAAIPLMSEELAYMADAAQIKKSRLLVNFAFPLFFIIAFSVGNFMRTGNPRILEAFMITVFILGGALWLQKLPMREIVKTALDGIKGVMPAIIILTLAFTINLISKDLGAARYVTESTHSWLTPKLLPILTFSLCSFIAFATGTSWGTYAIMIPIAVPLAFQFSGGEISSLPLATIAAVAGGGVFGDHCSPLSDTTILSSLGAASDHIDHVKTQLPYALLAAGISLAFYLGIGIL
jgi:Na+/H+ antiporter NhaC